jgi:hypothetical protein
MASMFALTGPHVEPPVSPAPAAIVVSVHTAVVHFGAGRQVRSFRMREPEGVILHYWISAPAGARVRGWAQIPHVTTRLEIRTAPYGSRSGCVRRRARVVCTQGEEWCPMPRRTWHFHVLKLAGRAGDVVMRFRVGIPPRGGAA